MHQTLNPDCSFNMKAILRCGECSGARSGFRACLRPDEVLIWRNISMGRQVSQEQLDIRIEVLDSASGIGWKEAPDFIITIVSCIKVPSIASYLNVSDNGHRFSRSIITVRNGPRIQVI